MGSLDEFYLFPCVLNADDIKKIKEFCGFYGILVIYIFLTFK